MVFTVTDGSETKTVVSFSMPKYEVNRVTRTLNVCGLKTYADGSTEGYNFVLRNDPEDTGNETEFDDWYPSFDADLKLYNWVADKLGFTGTVDLTGEPQ